MQRNKSHRILLVIPAVLASVLNGVIPARAAVTVLNHYRMGEGDAGAQPGYTASTTSDQAGSHPLILTGLPAYSTDVDTAAASQVSSRFSLDFGPGAYGTNTLLSTVTDNFGIEAWVKPTSVSGSRIIVYNGNSGSSGWGMHIANGIYQLLFGGVTAVPGSAAANNEWAHVALVRASGVATLYVNGVSVATTTATPNSPAGSFTVASAVNGGGEFLVGKVDEVRFFTFVPGNFSTSDLLLNRPIEPPPHFGPVWKKANVPVAIWNTIASSAYGNKLIAASQNGYVYTSSDYGANWTSNNFNAAIGAGAVASSADGNVLVVAPSGSTIRVSTDSGATWTPRESARNWRGVSCSSDGTKMVAVNFGGQIYTSTDTGATWTPHGPSAGWVAVASSADGSKLVAAIGDSGPGNLFVSTDSGTNWTQRGYNQHWTAVASSADGSKLLAVLDLNYGFNELIGGLSRSGDSGMGWTDPTTEQTALSFTGAASSSDGTRLAVCGKIYGFYYPPGLILTSKDSGSFWDVAFAPIKWWTGIASSADGTKLAATYRGSCQTCTDGGIYIYAESTAESPANVPALNIAMAGGTANLSWPFPSTGYVLQQNSNLATPNWVTVTNTPAVVNQVIAPATNNQNFYRLFQP